jgi:outer membrane protein OmpA-like peptidoglycan-associated protein
VIRKLPNGRWDTPLNAGDVINTHEEESSVFLAADGQTLYYSSNGHTGYGSSDVFMSRRLDDSWTNWSEPINLGPTINSEQEEKFYVIPASGDYVYYASNKDAIGALDVFRIGLPEQFRPKPVTLVTGRVLDQLSNMPMSATVVYEDLDTREQLGSVVTDATTGEYKIILPSGHRYGLRAEVPNYFSINQNLDLTEQANYKKVVNDLFVVPIKPGVRVPINNIFFETGKSNLANGSSLELDRLATILKANPNLRIEVSGHTDDVGADDSNLLLSKQRASSVTTYLEGVGVGVPRMRSVGYGETRPLVPNETDYNRSRNRRVEFTVL